jgi:hypothetical protein
MQEVTGKLVEYVYPRAIPILIGYPRARAILGHREQLMNHQYFHSFCGSIDPNHASIAVSASHLPVPLLSPAGREPDIHDSISLSASASWEI